MRCSSKKKGDRKGHYKIELLLYDQRHVSTLTQQSLWADSNGNHVKHGVNGMGFLERLVHGMHRGS